MKKSDEEKVATSAVEHLKVLAYLRDRDEPLPLVKVARGVNKPLKTTRSILETLINFDFVDFKNMKTKDASARETIHYVYTG